MENNRALDAKVLAQILLIESMVSHLPDEETIFAFVCRGLESVPGVTQVSYTSNNETFHSDHSIPITIDNYQFGTLFFCLSCSADFNCYLPYLDNLCHMLAVMFDLRQQRKSVLKAKEELELRVEQRTAELRLEVEERRRAEELALAHQLMAERYLSVSESIIIELDRNACITVINQRGCELLGYKEDEIIGQEWFALALPENDANELRDIFHKFLSREIEPIEYYENEIITRNKEVLTISWNNILLFNNQGQCTGSLSSRHDVTKRKKAESQARKLAFYDVLTGLPNRRLMIDRLHQSMVDSQRNHTWKALFFLDLDDFKDLNDSLGHDQGDLVLIESAQRIQNCLRDVDSVSRHGGDEFLVLLGALGNNIADAVNNAGAVAEKISHSLELPYQLNGGVHQSTVSIGIALFQGQDRHVDTLFKHADVAMYQAKSAGKRSYRFFNPQMQADIDRRRNLENDLDNAINNHEFELYFQPQVNHDQHCVGAEGLIRWNSPTRGIVSPLDFIPIAEANRKIIPIGRWVLEQACRQLLLWRESSLTRNLTLAINVSAVQFNQQSFAEQVIEVISQSGIDPSKLKLEITESLLVQDIDKVIFKMAKLKNKAISFSIDDFGTGYSSLAYVKRLPVSQLKIDRSFVRDIMIDPSDAAICKAIIAMSNSLDLEVIAEGVENDEQRQALWNAGCHYAQGYLFGRPMTANDFNEWLQHQNSCATTH